MRDGSRQRRRPGSAHVIAVLALVVALGGGYATAQSTGEPRPTAGYHSYEAEETEHGPDGSGGASLVEQLVIPTGTDLAVSAKLNLRMGKGEEFTGARVRCFLAAIGPKDRAAVTLEPGEAANLALESMGSVGTPGATNAADLYCKSGRSAYLTSDARIGAISLDAIERLTP